MYATGWEKRNGKKIIFLCSARVHFIVISDSYLEKENQKRDPLTHYTLQIDVAVHLFTINAVGRREEKTMKMNTHRYIIIITTNKANLNK